MSPDPYQRDGFCLIRQFCEPQELLRLRKVLQRFFFRWKSANLHFYQQKAINAAYLTRPEFLDDDDRLTLFRFLASQRLMDRVHSILGDQAAFMNTQLFFNPFSRSTTHYWHRDPQYHLNELQQQQALRGPQVVHFRLALNDEPGIELIPGTHVRWDTDEELSVRMQRNGFKNNTALSQGLAVPLKAGDLLIFSANMIHRGLYGLDRLALDILFCDPRDNLLAYVDPACLPTPDMLSQLECPAAFSVTRTFLQSWSG